MQDGEEREVYLKAYANGLEARESTSGSTTTGGRIRPWDYRTPLVCLLHCTWDVSRQPLKPMLGTFYQRPPVSRKWWP